MHNLMRNLETIYKELGNYKDTDINRHISDLEEADRFTEYLWKKQFEIWLHNMPRVVMLSEAPLIGVNRNYFYNSDTAPSSFFWFDDAKAVAGENFARGHKFQYSKEKKQFLIDKVTKSGLLILDLFPYALNNGTGLNYRKMLKKLYLKIFKNSMDTHLSEKLISIKNNCN